MNGPYKPVPTITIGQHDDLKGWTFSDYTDCVSVICPDLLEYKHIGVSDNW